MKSKRGIGAEVDWILALGLFLISLGSILVLFKPGINPVFEEETLLTIVQNGIEKNLTWSITKQPLFTEPVRYEECANALCLTRRTRSSNNLDRTTNRIQFVDGCSYDSTTRVIANCNSEFPLFDVEFPALTNNQIEPHVMVFQTSVSSSDASSFQTNELPDTDYESTLTPMNAQITEDSTLGDAQEAFDQLTGRDTQTSLERKLTYRLETSKNPVFRVRTAFSTSIPRRKYNFIHSSEIIDSTRSDLIGSTGTRRACSLPTYSCDSSAANYPNNCPIIVYNSNASRQCQLKYTLGVPETVEGLYLVRMWDLPRWETRDPTCTVNNLRGYDCVKYSFGFPEIQDFKITIEAYDTVNTQNRLLNWEFPSDVTPPAEASVQVRQFNTFILNEDAVRVPAVVTIAVW